MTVYVEIKPEYPGDKPAYMLRASGGKDVIAHVYPTKTEDWDDPIDNHQLYFSIPGKAVGSYIEVTDLEAMLIHMGYEVSIKVPAPTG